MSMPRSEGNFIYVPSSKKCLSVEKLTDRNFVLLDLATFTKNLYKVYIGMGPLLTRRQLMWEEMKAVNQIPFQ